MKKENVVLIVSLIIVVIILALIIGTLLIKNKISNKITVIQYEPGSYNQIQKFSIDSVEDINKLNKYVEEMKPSTTKVALENEIVIEYNNIRILMQLGKEDYCYYEDTENNTLYLSKMPKGLYQWAEEKIEAPSKTEAPIKDVDDNEPTISDTEFVDNAIMNLINSAEYSKMSDDEKTVACENLLKDLKSKQKIKSFYYSSLDMFYSFEYSNGVLGGIQIKDWDPYMN